MPTPVITYGLIGSLKAHPGKGTELVGALLDAARLIEGADGLHSWLVHVDATDADRVWITELWRDQDAHDASLERPGVRDHIMKTMGLLVEPPTPGVDLRPQGGIGLESITGRA
jgi:quinol monooxygenase YgiN